jgi:hypothetical protein
MTPLISGTIRESHDPSMEATQNLMKLFPIVLHNEVEAQANKKDRAAIWGLEPAGLRGGPPSQ